MPSFGGSLLGRIASQRQFLAGRCGALGDTLRPSLLDLVARSGQLSMDSNGRRYRASDILEATSADRPDRPKPPRPRTTMASWVGCGG
jgi:hypothetical protein